jgi:hypothetical protein
MLSYTAMLSQEISLIQGDRSLSEGVGKHSKEVDTALPGKHTRALYNGFKKEKAGILAQLRTGMAKLNGYLHRIGAVGTDRCTCGQAKETVKHFLFGCSKWDQQRLQLFNLLGPRSGCLSFCLGGKSATDPASPTWFPFLREVWLSYRSGR